MQRGFQWMQKDWKQEYIRKLKNSFEIKQNALLSELQYCKHVLVSNCAIKFVYKKV